VKRAHGSLRFTAALLFGLLWVSIGAQAQKIGPAKPVDLNTASMEELQQVPGIGPSTAKAIVRFRERSGPFQRLEDLLVIRGITKARLEKMRPYLKLSEPAMRPSERR
jgi:comEA protein